MALASHLFRGNAALEACAIKDPAHLTLGATGEHVAKIQFALATLDGLEIDRAELIEQTYGRSTAAAVLAYKKKRQIINRSYQSTADDIVGKMTIASLDKDMRTHEARPKSPGDCAASPRGFAVPASPVVATSARSSLVSRSSLLRPSLIPARAPTVTAPRQLGGFIRVFFQITSRAAVEDGYPLSASIERARDALFEHGITLFVEVRNGFADTLQFSERIIGSVGTAADNVEQIRKVSEDVRPGMPGVLRVIVCQMVGDKAGETFRRGVGGKPVPPYVLLNSQIIDRAHVTLIHEMIHASKNGPVVHDPEPSSIFFEFGSEKPGGIDRTFLKPEHARTLSTMSSRL